MLTRLHGDSWIQVVQRLPEPNSVTLKASSTTWNKLSHPGNGGSTFLRKVGTDLLL